MPKDRWQELCKLVEKDDGLPTRTVRKWTEDKLWFWNRYIAITTTSMVGKPSWRGGLVYVDLFAGAGVCKLEKSGTRIPGSVLIAALAPKPFGRLLICEKQRTLAKACQARLEHFGAASRSQVFDGDCNERISEIAGRIPDRALTIAFIDPEGLHARFETIGTLSKRGNVDLLILFADQMDVRRNLLKTYLKQSNSKLDQFLGPDSRWRERWQELSNPTPQNERRLFAGIYRGQLKKHLGYEHFEERAFGSDRQSLYILVFAAKHELGLDFFKKAIGKDPDRQGTFDFSD